MKRIVFVGGGYAGFYTALGLERKLMRSNTLRSFLDASPLHDLSALSPGGFGRLH